MINFALIICCVSLGMLIARLKLVPNDAYKSINIWLIYVALPTLALRFVPDIQWGMSSLIPSLSPLIMWCGAFVFITIYAKINKGIDKYTKTALLISCGICNSAFLGFPMVSAFFGENNLHYAIVFDQMTFIMFSTLVVSVILKTHNNKNVTPNILLKKIFSFPPFIATLTALVLSSFYDYSIVNPFLDKILATLSPLALFSIGLQLRFDNIKSELKNLSFGLLYKLIIGPAIILIFVLLLDERTILGKITIFQGSMPAHITSSLLAIQYGINPRLCGMFVGVGIVVCLVTSSAWYLVLQFL